MSRVQLALNVSNIDSAVEFYSKLFDTTPAKRKPGYANFAIANPPLKLVLIENTDEGAPGTLNHLGVEVMSAEEVSSAQTRLTGTGLETTPEDNVTCCYAVQDKVWVNDPDKAPWEIYTVTADAEEMHGSGEILRQAQDDEGTLNGGVGEGVCCGTGGSEGSGVSSKNSCC